MTTFSRIGRVERTRRRIASTALLATIGLTLALGGFPAAAATRTPYNTNLVRNPGFEAGAATNGYSPVAVPYWQTSGGNGTVVRYGAPNGFPTLAESTRISGGKKFFTSGKPETGDAECDDVLVQTVRIRGRAAAIDANRVRLDAKMYLGTYDSQSDTAVASLTFYDSAGISIAVGFQLTATHTAGYMLEKSTSRMLPPRTRSMKIFLFSSDTQGYCDAYFDRISLRLGLVP